MINALNLIGFTSLETLLISAGKADLMLAVKHITSLGFASLANLLDNFLTVTKLFRNDGLLESSLRGIKSNQTIFRQSNQTTPTLYHIGPFTTNSQKDKDITQSTTINPTPQLT